MPEAGTTAPDASEAALAGQIDALLSNMGESAATLAADQTSESLDRAVTRRNGSAAGSANGAPASATGRAADEALSPEEVESLAAQIDALVDEVATAAGGGVVAPDPVNEEPAAEGATAESIDAETGSAGPPVSEPESALATDAESLPEDAGEIDLSGLDAQLAAQAGPTVEPAPPPAMPPVAPTLPVSEAAQADADSRLREAPATASSALPAHLLDGGHDAPESEPREPRVPLTARLGGAVVAASAAAKPAAGYMLGLSARTLERAPKVARDTAGWIGLVTVFFACCMWAIVLFFRSIPTPEAYDVPSTVLEPGEPTPQPRPRPVAPDHGAAEEHAKPADSHGGGGEAPAADHGSGGH